MQNALTRKEVWENRHWTWTRSTGQTLGSVFITNISSFWTVFKILNIKFLCFTKASEHANPNAHVWVIHTTEALIMVFFSLPRRRLMTIHQHRISPEYSNDTLIFSTLFSSPISQRSWTLLSEICRIAVWGLWCAVWGGVWHEEVRDVLWAVWGGVWCEEVLNMRRCIAWGGVWQGDRQKRKEMPTHEWVRTSRCRSSCCRAGKAHKRCDLRKNAERKEWCQGLCYGQSLLPAHTLQPRRDARCCTQSSNFEVKTHQKSYFTISNRRVVQTLNCSRAVTANRQHLISVMLNLGHHQIWHLET